MTSIAFDQREHEQALASIGVGIQYRTDNAGRKVVQLIRDDRVSKETMYWEAGL